MNKSDLTFLVDAFRKYVVIILDQPRVNSFEHSRSDLRIPLEDAAQPQKLKRENFDKRLIEFVTRPNGLTQSLKQSLVILNRLSKRLAREHEIGENPMLDRIMSGPAFSGRSPRPCAP